jgi:CheY-like chemotaxis protein/two-component sensor histidine kinase
MNAILGFTDLMSRDSNNPLSHSHKEKLNQVTSSGKHILKIINELLDLSAVESGNLKLSIERVDLIPIVEDIVSIFQSLSKQYGIFIDHEKKMTDTIFVDVDLIRIKQVILNLISNAIKYNKPNGTVVVSYVKLNHYKIRLGIKDNGYGIPQDKMDKVFTPFERCHSEAKHIEGTGVGLTISKQLVELMSGVIGFESVEDKGSYFYIDLPISGAIDIQAEIQSPIKKISTMKPEFTKPKKILYIEDVLVNIELIKHILSLRDNVIFLSSTRALPGIEMAKSELPDLILMDLHLPDIDGISAFKKLQLIKEVKNIPVIALTANAMDGEANKAIDLGFRDYITKPINIDSFLKIIDKVL